MCDGILLHVELVVDNDRLIEFYETIISIVFERFFLYESQIKHKMKKINFKIEGSNPILRNKYFVDICHFFNLQ